MLIIGYGSPLRGDDAVGLEAAGGLGGIAVHQLMPELMEPISRADRVVFIDAGCDGEPGTISERVVEPAVSGTPFTHHVSPEVLLAGARDLYGRCPPAVLLTVTGADFELGNPLSAPVRKALKILLQRRDLTSDTHCW